MLILISLHEAKCDPYNLTKRIVGGYNCSVERFPFMVSIWETMSMKHFCGGTLIKPSFVLTAAYCMQQYESYPHLITVVSGMSQFNQAGLQRRQASTIFIHRNYNPKDFSYNIAVIHLEDPFIMNNYVTKFIKLPPFPINVDLIHLCKVMTAIGWGHDKWMPDTPGTDKFNHVLQCVDLPLISTSECASRNMGTLHFSFVCAMGTGKDVCQGDAGGPLLCGDTQYGIVSRGYGCGMNDQPGYYTRIDRFLSFIDLATNIPAKKRSRGVVFFWSTKLIVIFALFMELV
ncbi:trypsin-like [Coccinella septempunctata]|uniref:trypsin-like n=1 Tax=Coccinella septempunctata TaxID=41139 RepID=UPI001D08D01A|nr:trypsin-like [Coccinella septempunctata]